MLTADYDLLGVKSGDRILDMGCGFGRHAYEALRRGASVVACDLGFEELKRVRACLLYTSPSPRDLSTSRMASSA